MPNHQSSTKSGQLHSPVDAGICGIVEALSIFPQLETRESCERVANGDALVIFRYGKYWEQPWWPLAEFVFGRLGPALVCSVGDAVDLRVRVATNGTAVGDLSIRAGASLEVEGALRKIAERSPLGPVA
ncbi:MAG: hypothetical protein ACYCX6_09715 [Vulcanimicrobiaceae bacterium]